MEIEATDFIAKVSDSQGIKDALTSSGFKRVKSNEREKVKYIGENPKESVYFYFVNNEEVVDIFTKYNSGGRHYSEILFLIEGLYGEIIYSNAELQ